MRQHNNSTSEFMFSSIYNFFGEFRRWLSEIACSRARFTHFWKCYATAKIWFSGQVNFATWERWTSWVADSTSKKRKIRKQKCFFVQSRKNTLNFKIISFLIRNFRFLKASFFLAQLEKYHVFLETASHLMWSQDNKIKGTSY